MSAKTKDGFYKVNYDNTYVLLANGSQKQFGNDTNNIPVSNGIVNSSLNADLLDGLHIHTGINNEVNKIVRTNSNGHIMAGWINTISGDMTTTPFTRVYVSNDQYIRYVSNTNFIKGLGGPFLPLAGGTMTGTIHREYSSSDDTPFIWINSGDYDSYIFQVSSGTISKQYYGYALKYIGTGSGIKNFLRLYADNQNSTDIIALSINQSGNIGIGNDALDSYRLYVNGNSVFKGHVYPEATNTYDLGSSSLRWRKLYIGTANTYGSTTKPIYWNNGVPTACTYSLSSNVNSGTTNRIAWYSAANAISSGSITTDGAYLGAVSYLSINTAHQTSYRLYVNGSGYITGETWLNSSIYIIADPGIALLQSSYGLRSDYTSVGNPTEEYLKAWTKYAYNKAAGRTVLGIITPNSRGFIFADIYNNGLVTQSLINSGGNYTNATLDLPVHITGRYYPHGGTGIIFGTTYGVWYYRTNIDSSNLLGYYWANIHISASSNTGTTPQFGSVGINVSVNSSYKLNVSGNSLLAGTTYFGSKSYWINNSGVEYMNDIRASRLRLVDNWLGFYTSSNVGGNRLGYIQTDASYMYFHKENGNSGFNFNGNLVPSSTNTYDLGTSSLRWRKLYIGTADSYGSATKPIYWNNGVPTACTYELKSTVNSGTANRIAWYSAATTISSGSITTNGAYLGAVSYLSINTAHQTSYRLYVNGTTYLNGNTLGTRIWLNYNSNLSPSYSWSGAALTLPTIEIQNYTGANESMYPTLTLHHYGYGGPRLGSKQGVLTIYGGNEDARTLGSRNSYFSSMKIYPNEFDGLYVNDIKVLLALRRLNTYITDHPTNGMIPPSILEFKNAGYPVYTDPEFASGNNSIGVYNNNGNGTVTITREAAGDHGNSSGYQLKIITNGSASPGAGGFIQTISSRANAIFIQIFRAKIPVGWKVNTASNSQGTNAREGWLTNQDGTGKWEWYARYVYCGNTGTFSNGGHVYLTGTSNTSVTWYVSYCNVIDITKENYDGLRTRYSDYANTLTNPGKYYWANLPMQTSSSTTTVPTFSWATFSRVSDHGVRAGTFRGLAVGSQTGEFIHMYERVAIGSPAGWGSRPAPSYGLATYGGAWLATDTGSVGIGTTSPSYKLHVIGDSYTTGWSRADSGFCVEGQDVYFTSQESIGAIQIVNSNEFVWASSTNTLYFNYRATNRGTTVNNYIWNAGSSSTYADHTLGKLHIFPTSGSYSYNEGIRIHSASNGWTTLILCGTDLTGNSGTSANSWSLHTYDGNFYLNKNNSSGATVNRLWARAGGGFTFGNTSNSSYVIESAGDIRTATGWFRSTGNYGWYNDTYSGGWYMTDSTYVKVYNSKAVYTANSTYYAYNTAGGFYGKMFSLNTDHYILKPWGANFTTTSSSYTGAITITLPASIGNTMTSMWIDVYLYSTNKSFSVHVGGYTYNNSTWTNNPFAMVYGAEYTVRLGHNGTSFIIYIGETNSTWAYPQITVRDVILGYSPSFANWSNQWTIGFSTSFSNVTATITNYAYTTKNAALSNKGTANRIAWYNRANSITSGLITTDGSYLGAISYLSINNAHQTGYRLYVNGTTYHTGTLYVAGQPAIQTAAGAGNWNYIRMHNGSNYWDIATKSDSNSGALDFRPGGANNIGPRIDTNGRVQVSNVSNSTTNYDGSSMWIREYHYGGSQSDTWGNAPRLGWHWSGRVAAQIGLSSSGWLYEAPLSATNFYRIVVEGNTGVTWGINISGSADTADTVDGYHADQLVPRQYNNRFYPFIKADDSRSIWHKVTLPWAGFTSGSSAWMMTSMELVLGGAYLNNNMGRIYLQYYFSKNASNVWSVGQVQGITIGNRISDNGITIKYDIENPGIFYVKVSNNIYNSFAIENISANDTAPSFDFRNTTITAIAEGDVPASATGVVPLYHTITTQNGYWANLPIQLASSNTTVPSFGAIRMNGATSAGTNYITGSAGRIYFGGNFHIDSLGSNATYINHYTTNNVYMVTGGGKVGIGITSPAEKLHINGNIRGDGTLFLRPDNDATLKIYSGKITDGYSDGFICMQTSIDGTDGQSHSYPTSYGSRCVIALQPRGGEVYIGKTITAASTSADSNYKLNVDSKAIIQASTLDNTAFRNTLTIFGNNSNESSGNDFTETNSSWGIGFQRQWSSGTITGICAGIFVVPTSSWRAGLAFRVKNNTTASGGIHDTTALYISPAGTLLQQNKNSWLNLAKVQIGRLNTTVYTDRSCIGTSDGNLHIDSYQNKGLYLQYYSNGGYVYFHGSSYRIQNNGQIYFAGYHHTERNNNDSVLLAGGGYKLLSDFSTSKHTHTFILGATTITTNGSTYNSINGPFNINTNSNVSNSFSISRNSASERVNHWVDDSIYHIEYTNDETSNSIAFRFINTDTESPHSPSQASDTTIYLNSSRQFYPNVNNTGSIGTSTNRWSKLYVGTADSYGSTTKPIYWNNGVPTACTYSLSSNVNSGTINTLAYYSAATTISSYIASKGSGIKLFYLNAGVPTESSSTVGATNKPIFLSSGTLTASTSTIGSGVIPIYMTSGTLTASTSTIGSSTKGVYLNGGTITAMSYSLSSNINSGTANRIAWYSAANAISSGSITTDGGYLGSVSYLSINTAHQTSYRLYVNGNSIFKGHVYPGATNTYDLGSSSLRWRTLYLKGCINYIMDADTSNAKTPLCITNTSNIQIAEIGYHNTGDTNGAFIITPYDHTGTSFWSGTIGLYIGKNNLKWENKYIARFVDTPIDARIVVASGTIGNVTNSTYTIAGLFTAFSGGTISSSGNTLTQSNHTITIGGTSKTAGSSTCNIINSNSLTGSTAASTSTSTYNLSITSTINGVASTKNIDKLWASQLNLIYCRDDSSPDNKEAWNAIKNGSSNTQTNKVQFYTIYGANTSIAPTTYGEMLEILSRNANHWQPQLWFGAGKNAHLYYRNKNYNDNTWGSWLTILDSNNYTSYVNNYYWANIKVSTTSSTTTQPQFGYVGINTSVNSSYKLNVSGNSLLAGTTYFGSTSYWINNGGVEYMKDIRASRLRLIDNYLGFYTSNNAGGNRLGYIQTDASYMYFRKENGNNGFNFNGNLVPSSNNTYQIGTSANRWSYGYYNTCILIGDTSFTGPNIAANGTYIAPGYIELNTATPYIDFHPRNSTSDYNVRIIADGTADAPARFHIQYSGTAPNLTYNSRTTSFNLYHQGTIYSSGRIENAEYFLNNINAAGGGYYLYGNNVQYGRLYIQKIGTANSGNGNATRGEQGEVYLYLGNNIARPAAGTEGGANNSRGRIIIYGTGTGGTTIMDGSWSGNHLTVVTGTNSTAGSTTESIVIVGNSNKKSTATASSTGRIRLYGEEANYHDIYPGAPNGNRTHYLPNATGWIATGGNGTSTGAGSATNPVYLNTSGVLTGTTYSLSATVNAGTANRISWYNRANSITSGSITTDGGYLGAVSYLSINTAHQTSYRLYVNGNSIFKGHVYPEATNTYDLGSSSLRWSKLYVGTEDSYGSDAVPVYWNNGVPTACIYSLSSNVNSGTVNRIAWYNGANSITSGSITTDGGYLGAVSYLSINTAHQTSYRLYVNGNSIFKGHVYPGATNTYDLGSSSLRWRKLYIGTADSYGSATKPIYWNAGVPAACTYELKATVNSGTANRIAWYSGANAISSASTIYASNTQLTVGGTSAPANSGVFQAIGTSTMQHIYPQTTNKYNLGSTSLLWQWIHTNKINLNRAGNVAFGRIYFYNSTYYTWVDYMSNSTAGSAPTGGQPSTTTEVTSWARRSLIENQSGYGWIWESCSNAAASANTAKPAARMSLSSNTGRLRIEANASSTTNNTGGLIVSSVANGSSGNIGIELWRGSNASWSISNESGTLHIRDNYTSSAQTTYLNDQLNIAYNTGIIKSKTILPFATNTYDLGSNSLRWRKLYIGTADSYGSATKPIYWNAGVPTTCTYELKSTVNNGTANRIAWYSAANAISSGSITTDGAYLGAVSYLSINTAHQTSYRLYVNGNSIFKGHVYPGATNTYDLGSSSLRWRNIYSVLGNYSGQVTVSVATGTSPFKVTSTTLNTNLNADLLDGYHASSFFKNLGGSNYITINVGGDANTYYPVVIGSPSEYYPYQFVNITRNYSETAPDTWNTSTHKGGLSMSIFWNGSKYWDGNSSGSEAFVVRLNQTYCTMVGGIGNSTAGKVVWLRGGGANYHIFSMNGKSQSATVYLSTFTDSASNNFEPKTTPQSIKVRWPGWADGSDISAKLQTARTITIGATGRSFDGTANISWTVQNIIGTSAIGGTSKPIYYNGTNFVAISDTKGSATKPIWLNAGTISECTYSLSSTVNNGTANRMAWYNGANSITSGSITTNGAYLGAVSYLSINTAHQTSYRLYVNGTGNFENNIWVRGSGVYLRLGPQNSSHAHYETNAGTSHWFNKRVDVNGAIWRYNTNYGIADDGQFYAKAVYTNRDASSTYGGVSLYSNDANTYAIFFRGTGTYGTLGRVQSDWATYLTMSDTAQRGWIFRSGSTNYASISARGEAFFSAVGRDNYIAYPAGASSVGNSGSVTGAIAIYLPTTAFKSCTMLKMTVEIYNYSTNTSSTYVISGYNYSDSNWYNVTAYSKGASNNSYSNLTVRYGDNGSRNIIWIGETNTSWSYPQVYVKDVTLGHSGYDYNRWAQGWSIGFVTSFNNVRTSVSYPATGSGYWANLPIQSTTSTTTSPTFSHIYLNGYLYMANSAGSMISTIDRSGNSPIFGYGQGQSGYHVYYTGRTVSINAGTTWSSVANGIYIDESNRVGVGTNGPSEKLSVNGWVGTIGATGWYNISYGGGWYMYDTSWVRTYNSKGVVATCYYASNWASATYLLRSDGGAAAFNWSGQSGQPTWIWGGNSQHNYYVYNPSNFSVNYANYAGYAHKLDIYGYTSGGFSYYQTSDSFDGNSGWCHYLISNHGDGASYYHYTIGLPFWGAPIYRRQTGSTSSVTPWYTFITTENYTSYASRLNISSYNSTFYPCGSTSYSVGAPIHTLYAYSGFWVNSGGAYHNSDISLKYDIRDILYEDIIKLFNTENAFVRYYKWKNTKQSSYGFIAQELQEYCPEAVYLNNDTGYYGVNYEIALSKIVGVLFKKIKEQDRLLKELQRKIEDL